MKWWSNSEVFVNGPFVPEKRLLAAVLQRAITDYLTGDDEMRESAKTWIIDNEYTSDAPLTFRFICEALDLDCDTLRKAILVQSDASQDEAELPQAELAKTETPVSVQAEISEEVSVRAISTEVTFTSSVAAL